jgi:hypothetical protein
MLKSPTRAPSFRDEPATVSSALRAGIDADKFTYSLALHHAVDPDATARARRTADIDSARLWLSEGVPIADVLTMLEVRRRFESFPHDSRNYAVEILLAVRAEIPTTSQPRRTHRKEPENAFA